MRIYSVLIVIIRQIQQIRLLQHFSFYSRSLSGNIILGLDFKFTIFTNPVVQVKKVVLTHNIDTLTSCYTEITHILLKRTHWKFLKTEQSG